MRMPAFSRIAAIVVSRRTLATGVATLALGAALPLLGGAAPAWACGDEPTGAATASAPAAAPVHWSGSFIPELPDSITAGGPAAEVGVEIGNSTGAAASVAPVLSFDNTAASSHQGGGHLLRPQDFTVEVMVNGAWRTLPVRHSCDPTLNVDTSSLAQRLDDGHAARLLFRISLSADAPADQQNITLYTGPDAQGETSSHVLKVVRNGAPEPAPAPAASDSPAPANPAKGNGFQTGFFMMANGPLTITPGGEPLEIGVESLKESGTPYQDVRPELVLSTDDPQRFVTQRDVVLQVHVTDGWQPVPVHSTGPSTLIADLSGIKGSPMVNGRAVHFTYRLALKPGAVRSTTKLQARVFAVADDGTASDSDVRDLTVLPAVTAPSASAKPSAAPARQNPAPAAPAAATSAAPSATTGTAPTQPAAAAPATTAPSAEPTGSSSATATPRLAYTGGGSSALPLAGAGGALVLLGAGALVVTRRRRADHR